MNPDKHFKDKLYNMETPLGSNVSFEKVMAMRGSRSGLVWWKSGLLVLGILSAVSVAGYLLSHPAGAAKQTAATQNGGKQLRNAAQGEANSNTASGKTTVDAGSNANTASDRGFTGKTIAASTTGNAYASGSNLYGNGKTAEAPNPADLPAKVEHPDNTDIPNLPEPTVDADATDNTEFDFLSPHGIRPETISPFEMSTGNAVAFDPRSDLKGRSALHPDFEFMAFTGGQNYRNFKNQPYSLRGTNHFGQYSASALFGIRNGLQLSAGLSYTENYGNGEWRKISDITTVVTGSHQVAIIQPGMPTTYKTVYDTSYNTRTVAENGNVSYHLTKVSLPLGFRYNIGSGKFIWRINGAVAPGMMVYGTGTSFNRNESAGITKTSTRTATMDFRLSAGIYVPVTMHLAFTAEPAVQYQSVLGHSWNGYNKLFTGFGIGLVYKP